MGKAQSKRSVDITTDTKKGVEDEVTEKMEKIEDVDKQDINGDAPVQLNSEKNVNDDVENDKDTTTEKNQDIPTSGSPTDEVASTPAAESKTEDEVTPSEEISPLTDESATKKSKKEKVKKKWSFRSISFGKKDKQKPLKSEETTENTSATLNGTEEDKATPETEEESQKANEPIDVKSDETSKNINENGDASEKELDREVAEEKTVDGKEDVEKTATETTPITENNEVSKNDTAVIVTSQETEKPLNVTSNSEVIKSDNNLEEKPADETSKNGNNIEEVNATVPQSRAEDEIAKVIAEEKNIPGDVKIDAIPINGDTEEIHENGTNNLSDLDDKPTKANTEVKINTDKKASAETLDILSSSTSNILPNDPVNFQNLNELSEEPNNVVENDEELNVSRDLNASGSNDDVLAVENNTDEITELNKDEKFGDEALSIGPPPLPVSPPPSQVSVFAFKDNEDSVGGSTENAESSNTQVEEIADEQLLLEQTADDNQEENNLDKSSKLTDSDESHVETGLENNTIVIDNNKDDDDTVQQDTHVDQESNEQSHNEPQCLTNGNSNMTDIEVNASAEHTENEEEQYIDKTASQGVETQHIDLVQNESIGENLNQIANDKQSEIECKTSVNEDINIVQEDENNTSESLSRNDTDNNKRHSSQNTNEGNGDDEGISHKIDNLVREETKELNPSDIKGSAAVPEIKQDLSVACE